MPVYWEEKLVSVDGESRDRGGYVYDSGQRYDHEPAKWTVEAGGHERGCEICGKQVPESFGGHCGCGAFVCHECGLHIDDLTICPDCAKKLGMETKAS